MKANESVLFAKAGSQAEALTLLDMRVQYEDGDTTDAVAAAKVLQGLVNRQLSDKLYLLNDCTDMTHEIGGKEWETQLEWLAQAEELRALPRTVLTREPGPNGGLHALLKKYGPILRGLVIWDPRTHNKVNMATFGAAVTIASQQTGLAVSPALQQEIADWGIQLPVLEDLRHYHFTSDHEALLWSIEQYWPTCNRSLNTVFSLGMDGWSPIHEWADNWWSNEIFHEGPIDYAVAVNGFSFNINMMDGNDDHALLSLLRKYPEGRTAILGWVPTHPFVYGFSEMPTCLNLTSYYVMGVNGFSNMSVFASFPEREIRHPAAKRLDVAHSDVFINFLVTDGDALHCVYRGMFSAFTTRRDAHFGKVPITWTISPALASLAPPVYRFFSEHLPPGSDFAAAWANKVHTIHDSHLTEVLSDIREHARQADIPIVWTVHSAEETQQADLNDWAGIIVGYSNSRVTAGLSERNVDTSVFGTWMFGDNSAVDIADGIRQWVQSHPDEGALFMTVALGAAFDESGTYYAKAAEVAKRLTEEPASRTYKFVNARDMALSYQGYRQGGQK